MTPSELVSVLHGMGVRCVSPGDGRVKLLVDSGAVPQAAIDLAKPLKTELATYLNSQPCGCGAMRIPFGLDVQGWRNWDCPACKDAKPICEVPAC
jgi:hypothetical protein